MIPVLLFDEFLSPLKCQNKDLVFVDNKLNSIYQSINKKFKVKIKNHEIKLTKPNYSIMCGDSYYKHKWIPMNNSSFIGLIFLNDYNKESPFDDTTECYGGILHLTQYKTMILPKAGQMVIFPSSRNFSYVFDEIKIGKLEIIKVLFYCDSKYQFDFTKWSNNWSFS